MKKLDKYLIFSILALCTYTVVEQILSYKLGYERSTLTTCFYGAFGGEILGCVVIKVFNIKAEEKMDSSGIEFLSMHDEG